VFQRFSTANVIPVLVVGMLMFSPAAFGQLAPSCSGTQDFAGFFAFAANRLVWAPASVAPTPTTTARQVTVDWDPLAATPPGTSGQFSNTPIGKLAFGALGDNPFTTVGRLFADGGGNLFTGDTFTNTGSYTVSTDCSMTLTLRDVTSTASGVASAPVVFRGILTDRGASASLVQATGNGGGFTQLLLTRPYLPGGCGASSLSGAFGLSLFGLDLGAGGAEQTSPRSPTPFTFVHRVVADGSGTLRADATTGGSGQPSSQPTGTYTVNNNCTGTMTISVPSANTTDPPTTFRTNFILTEPSIQETPIGAGVGSGIVGVQRPQLLFVIDGPRQSGIGFGR
jgi:hypothetical protein